MPPPRTTTSCPHPSCPPPGSDNQPAGRRARVAESVNEPAAALPGPDFFDAVLASAANVIDE
jgi:hypothetical protein